MQETGFFSGFFGSFSAIVLRSEIGYSPTFLDINTLRVDKKDAKVFNVKCLSWKVNA